MSENIHRVSKAIVRNTLAGRAVEGQINVNAAKEEAVLHIARCPECRKAINLDKVVVSENLTKPREGVEKVGDGEIRVDSLEIYLGLAKGTTAFSKAGIRRWLMGGDW